MIKEKAIKISAENYDAICKIARKEGRMKKWVIDLAVQAYLKGRGKGDNHK